MSVVVFGDLHFNDERPWSLQAGREFIKFLDSCPSNHEDNIGVFLGDITEKASLSPLVYELLFDFFHSLHFKYTYILRGNHDKKKRKDRWVAPLSFLRSNNSPYTKIEFIDEPKYVQPANERPLIFLPFRAPNEEPNMDTYVESLESSWYQNKDALVFGHFADTSSEAVRDNLINLKAFKGEIVLGHIHNPFSDNYIGSVMPNSLSEKNLERYYRVYTMRERGTGIWEMKRDDIQLPNFLDYYDITFPEELPKVDCTIPIYTIHNCQSQEAATARYPGIYIRKCIYDNLVDADSFSDIIESASSEHSLFNTTKLWLDSQDTISPSIKEKVLKYFHATN